MKVTVNKGRQTWRVVIRKAARRKFSEQDRPDHYQLEPKRWWPKGQMPRRDMKARVYRSQTIVDKYSEKLPNVRAAAEYCRSIMETAWFQRRFPHFSYCVIEHGGYREHLHGSAGPDLSSGGHVFGGQMTLYDSGLTHRTVIHELAHAVLPHFHRHDRLWARVYVDMIGFKFGRQAGLELKSAFKEVGLLTNPVRQANVPASTIKTLRAAAERKA